MQRRDFTTGIGALLMTAGLGRPALADGGDAFEQGMLRAMRLRFAADRITTIDGFGIGGAQGSVGLRWSHAQPVYNENRLDLSGAAPVVGSLFRTPFRVRWARALTLGPVDLVGSQLVGHVPDAARHAGAQVTIGAGDLSWDLRGHLAPLPAPPGRGQRVGEARLGDDGRILVLATAIPLI